MRRFFLRENRIFFEKISSETDVHAAGLDFYFCIYTPPVQFMFVPVVFCVIMWV